MKTDVKTDGTGNTMANLICAHEIEKIGYRVSWKLNFEKRTVKYKVVFFVLTHSIVWSAGLISLQKASHCEIQASVQSPGSHAGKQS